MSPTGGTPVWTEPHFDDMPSLPHSCTIFPHEDIQYWPSGYLRQSVLSLSITAVTLWLGNLFSWFDHRITDDHDHGQVAVALPVKTVTAVQHKSVKFYLHFQSSSLHLLLNYLCEVFQSAFPLSSARWTSSSEARQ